MDLMEISDGEHEWSMEDPQIRRSFQSFVDEHQDVLMDMYLNFLSNGKFFFGISFHQTGSFYHFARYVFMHTLPGITH